jgi:hypothetical protein
MLSPTAILILAALIIILGLTALVVAACMCSAQLTHKRQALGLEPMDCDDDPQQARRQ